MATREPSVVHSSPVPRAGRPVSPIVKRLPPSGAYAVCWSTVASVPLRIVASRMTGWPDWSRSPSPAMSSVRSIVVVMRGVGKLTSGAEPKSPGASTVDDADPLETVDSHPLAASPGAHAVRAARTLAATTSAGNLRTGASFRWNTGAELLKSRWRMRRRPADRCAAPRHPPRR